MDEVYREKEYRRRKEHHKVLPPIRAELNGEVKAENKQLPLASAARKPGVLPAIRTMGDIDSRLPKPPSTPKSIHNRTTHCMKRRKTPFISSTDLHTSNRLPQIIHPSPQVIQNSPSPKLKRISPSMNLQQTTLPTIKLTSKEKRKYSHASIPDIVGVQFIDDPNTLAQSPIAYEYRPLPALSNESSEIIINCRKFQRLPGIEKDARGVVDSGCSVGDDFKKGQTPKIKRHRQQNSTSRMSPRRVSSTRLPKL